MNFSAYDIVNNNFTEGTWVNPNFKRLYSTKITPRRFCILLKKYSPNENAYNYYIALTDEKKDNVKATLVVYTKHKQIKLDIRDIWDCSSLKYIHEKSYINIELVEKSDNGEIYKLDI